MPWTVLIGGGRGVGETAGASGRGKAMREDRVEAETDSFRLMGVGERHGGKRRRVRVVDVIVRVRVVRIRARAHTALGGAVRVGTTSGGAHTYPRLLGVDIVGLEGAIDIADGRSAGRRLGGGGDKAERCARDSLVVRDGVRVQVNIELLRIGRELFLLFQEGAGMGGRIGIFAGREEGWLLVGVIDADRPTRSPIAKLFRVVRAVHGRLCARAVHTRRGGREEVRVRVANGVTKGGGGGRLAVVGHIVWVRIWVVKFESGEN